MKCPVCREPDLIMADRQGIEIDYCPRCRGVWLDRGELDKIIERSAEQSSRPDWQGDRYEERPRYDDDYYKKGKHSHKRRGLLGEIFDFD